MTAPRRRLIAKELCEEFHASQRRVSRALDLARSGLRYSPVVRDARTALARRIEELAGAHPRFGYRRVHAMLVAEGWQVNVKRVERLWRREGLRVPAPRSKASGQKAVGADTHSLWALPATGPGHIWSYDFMSLRTANGAGLRLLNVIDEFTRFCVGFYLGYSIGSTDVRRALEGIFARHGRPELLRSDNGREFIASGLQGWLTDQGVTPIQVEKGSPQQNGYIERFNGSMRRELLNAEQFHSVLEAKVVIEDWLVLYNTRRAHRGLGGRTPAAYAKMARSQQADNRAGGGG